MEAGRTGADCRVRDDDEGKEEDEEQEKEDEEGKVTMRRLEEQRAQSAASIDLEDT